MSPVGKKNASQDFLDTNQYSSKSILKYERIFGHTWVSTGGETTTKDICIKLGLKPGKRVLDIGCGTGGSSFFLARQYGVTVAGIDLSKNMLDIASDRLKREEPSIKERVSFKIADATKVEYPNQSFDLVYSRDTILHIADKEALMKSIYKWLKPGGRLCITDYCHGDQKPSKAYLDYVTKREYHVTTVKEYGQIIEKAGFSKVDAQDFTHKFLEALQYELKYFIPTKESFIKEFSESDYHELVDGWHEKVDRVKIGDQCWGLFIATK